MLNTLTVVLVCIVVALILSFVMERKYTNHKKTLTMLQKTLWVLACVMLIALAFVSPLVATYLWVIPVLLLLPYAVIMAIIFQKSSEDKTDETIEKNMLTAIYSIIIFGITGLVLHFGGFGGWTPEDDAAVVATKKVEEQVSELKADVGRQLDGLQAEIGGVKVSFDGVGQKMFSLSTKTQTGIEVAQDVLAKVASVEDQIAGVQAGVTGLKTAAATSQDSIAVVDKKFTQLDAKTQTSIKGVQDGVNELQTDVAEVKAAVTTTQDSIAAVDGKVADVKTDVTGLKNDFTGIQDSVDSAQAGIFGVQNGIAGLKADVAGVEKNVMQLNTNTQAGVAELRTAFVDVQASVDGVNHQIAQVDANAQASVANVEDSLTELKADVAGVKTSVVDLEKSVSMLLASQKGVRGEIASLTKKVTSIEMKSEANAEAVANVLNAFEERLGSSSCHKKDVAEIKAALEKLSKALEKKAEKKPKETATTSTSCRQVRWNGCNWYYVN